MSGRGVLIAGSWLTTGAALWVCVERYGWVNVAFGATLWVLAIYAVAGVIDVVLDRRRR